MVSSTPSSLQTLPLELILEILTHIPPHRQLPLRATSRYFFALLDNLPSHIPHSQSHIIVAGGGEDHTGYFHRCHRCHRVAPIWGLLMIGALVDRVDRAYEWTKFCFECAIVCGKTKRDAPERFRRLMWFWERVEWERLVPEGADEGLNASELEGIKSGGIRTAETREEGGQFSTGPGHHQNELETRKRFVESPSLVARRLEEWKIPARWIRRYLPEQHTCGVEHRVLRGIFLERVSDIECGRAKIRSLEKGLWCCSRGSWH